jgi:hypothetical protein
MCYHPCNVGAMSTKRIGHLGDFPFQFFTRRKAKDDDDDDDDNLFALYPSCI